MFSTQHAYIIIGTIISDSSSSGWALWKSFILEFSEFNLSVSALVELLKNLVGFFESNEVPSALHYAHEFSSADGTATVLIEGVEGLISVETWSGGKSLSGELSSVFNSNDGSPHGSEFIGGSWLEAVVSSDWSWGIVRWSSGNLGVSESIVGKESSLEFSGIKFSIAGAIISGNKKINLFISGINTNGIKTAVKFS